MAIVIQNCLRTLIGLGLCLLMVGVICFGLSVEMGEKLKVLNHGALRYLKYGQHDSSEFDVCNPSFAEDADDVSYASYSQKWWIKLCPEVVTTSYQVYGSYEDNFAWASFPAICTCNKSRMAAVVLMGLVASLQVLVGIAFSIIGYLSPESCCRPRKAWVIFFGFVLLLPLTSFISFVLALHFGMYGADPDADPDAINFRQEKYDLQLNRIGAAFTAFSGIDLILNIVALGMAIFVIVKGNKNDNQTASTDEEIDEDQEKGQDQGQGSRGRSSDADNPPSHSKSHTHTHESGRASVKSHRSSRISNTQK